MTYNKNNIKRILFVVHSFVEDWAAGVENYTFALAKALDKIDVKVSFFYPKIAENSLPEIIEGNYEGIEVFKMLTTSAVQLITEIEAEKYDEIFERFLDEKEFDVVHFHHFFGLPLSFAEIVKKRDIKLFITLHDFWLVCPRIHFFINEKNAICNMTPDPFNCANCMAANKQQRATLNVIFEAREKRVKNILNSADYISAPSKFTAEKFSHLNIFKQIDVAPLGLEPVEAKPAKIKNEIIFGYIGSIAPVKNVSSLVKIFKRISPKQKLFIYGNGNPNEIELLLNEIKDFPNIEYRGAYIQKDLGEIFAQVDVIIVPSFTETYSFTLREALSAGKPVIASAVGGILDIIDHKKNGLLFSPFDEEDMQNTIEEVIKNPDILKNLVKEKTKIITIVEDAEYWKTRYVHNGEKPKVSIIVPVFNKVELTKDCISSIFENTVYPNYEIIIVDNNSTDGTKNYLTELELKHENVTVIFNNTNLGFAKANNLATKIAEGKYLHFLNNDTRVKKFWLSSLVELAENDDNVYAVGSKLLFPNRTIQHAGVIIFRKRSYILPTHLYYKFPQNVADFVQPKLFQILTAASLLIKKSEFQKVNEFDESYWNGYEDVDLCLKLKSLGGDLIWEPRSVVLHYESQSGPERFVATEKNERILNRKWYGKIQEDYIVENEDIKKNNFRTLNNYFPDKLKNKKASIIIVTYNSEETISSCLNSVVKTMRDGDEVVVVDNNSTDNTVKILTEYERENPNIKVLIENENHGFSKGCNLGIENSGNPFIVLLNPDTAVYGNWLQKLIFQFNDPKVGAVGPVSNYVAGLQKHFLYLNPENVSDDVAEINNLLEKSHSKAAIETKLLIGFCLVLNRKILNQCGFLDEELFLGNDDLEISWRLRLSGYKLIISPDTFVLHKGQHSFNSFNEENKKKFTRESTDTFYNKLVKYYGDGNVPPPEKLWGISWFSPTNAKFNSNKNLFSIQEKWIDKFGFGKNGIIVSVIVPVFNQKDVTQEFLTSIGESIPKAVEIIIIDNNSDKMTREFLRSYSRSTSNVVLISNSENLGFPKAINQGMKISRGEYIVIANNDIILTENWLQKMILHAERSPEIGIVGPVSNRVSGYQKLKAVDYENIEQMREFAENLSKENEGKYFEFPRVAFLCALIKREVIEKIGGLDEQFTPGNYEDDDYCLRAQLAGFKTVIALDVFIHHYGSKSFTADGEEKYQNLLNKNKKKFLEKWGASPDEIWLQHKKPKMRELFLPLYNGGDISDIISLASKDISNGDYKTAYSNLIKVVQLLEMEKFDLNNENIKAHDILNITGKVALYLEKLDEAKYFFTKELELGNSNSRAYKSLGELFEKAGDTENALKCFTVADSLGEEVKT